MSEENQIIKYYLDDKLFHVFNDIPVSVHPTRDKTSDCLIFSRTSAQFCYAPDHNRIKEKPLFFRSGEKITDIVSYCITEILLQLNQDIKKYVASHNIANLQVNTYLMDNWVYSNKAPFVFYKMLQDDVFRKIVGRIKIRSIVLINDDL